MWIYTPNERDAEIMDSDIFINYYQEFARNAGYQVRFVNSWNTYDWLPPSIIDLITHTMQNSLIDEGVHNLLKLALLYSKGGILI